MVLVSLTQESLWKLETKVREIQSSKNIPLLILKKKKLPCYEEGHLEGTAGGLEDLKASVIQLQGTEFCQPSMSLEKDPEHQMIMQPQPNLNVRLVRLLSQGSS